MTLRLGLRYSIRSRSIRTHCVPSRRVERNSTPVQNLSAVSRGSVRKILPVLPTSCPFTVALATKSDVALRAILQFVHTVMFVMYHTKVLVYNLDLSFSCQKWQARRLYSSRLLLLAK